MTRDSAVRTGLYLAVLALLAVSLFFIFRDKGPTAGPVATVWVEGEAVMEIPLEGHEDGTFSIMEEAGRDITFQIKDGAIRFLTSDCPDKVCVNTGFLHEDGEMATCLPNRTVLTVAGTEPR